MSVGFTKQIFVDCKVISKNCAVLSSLCNHFPEDKMYTAITLFEEKIHISLLDFVRSKRRSFLHRLLRPCAETGRREGCRRLLGYRGN